MSKVGIIYWSSTGNTEAMAQAVEEGAKAAGAELVEDEALICNNTPDDEGLEACRELGGKLA